MRERCTGVEHTPAAARDEILALTEAATAVAVSVLLGNLRLIELPSGGSITLACVPLLAFAVLRGVRRGALVCTCAGLAHAASGGTIVHPVQLVLDYGVAYAAYAIAGFARAGSRASMCAAIIVAGLVSLAASTVSGVIFFAQGFASTRGAVLYALGYNAATFVPEVILACLLVPSAVRAIQRADPAHANAAHAALRTPRRAPALPQPEPQLRLERHGAAHVEHARRPLTHAPAAFAATTPMWSLRTPQLRRTTDRSTQG